MRYKAICHILSNFLYIFSGILLLPLLVSVYFDFVVKDTVHPYPSSFEAFLITLIFTLCIASVLKVIGRNAQRRFYRKESLLLVFFIWIFISLLGAAPFYITRTLETPIDAIFESVSGFTTTGSSIILPKQYASSTGEEVAYVKKVPGTKNKFMVYNGTVKAFTNPFTGQKLEGLEAISRPILFWRSFTQWLGGIGVVFIFIAVFPGLAIGGKLLYESESHPAMHETSPQEALMPRVKEVSSYLWKTYALLTLFEILLLYYTNPVMKLFDAVCISFSTISTGGFAIHQAGMAYYTLPITQWIVMAFMILGAINFALYFYIIRGIFKKVFTAELLLFWIFIILSCALVSWKLYDGGLLSTRIRAGCFQSISALTCTGFYTENYDKWPLPCQAIMIIVMFIGGMTGSTSGGIKTSRHIILFRSFKKKLEMIYRPSLVKKVQLGSVTMDHEARISVLVFFWIIVIAATSGSLLFIFNGLDLETAAGLAACSINNVGLTFRMAGPGNTCAFLPVFSKIISIILMLLGRLEFYALFILFTRRFWKST